MARRISVLEIGGTHVSAAVVDTDGWQVVDGPTTRPIEAHGSPEQIVKELTSAGVSLDTADTSLWGVALPGPFDYARGIADYHGVAKFDALRGMDLGAALRHALTADTGRVVFLNDATAFALGEWMAGAASGHDRAVGITLGTGVGSAFLAGGVAQTAGPGVPPQGRIDLVRIDGRPLEDTVSSRAIQARYAALAAGEATAALAVREIAALAKAGDPVADQAISAPLEALGRVLGPLVIAFRADVVVLGGSISLAWEVIAPALTRGMDRASPGWSDSAAVVAAARFREAALIGAAHHAQRSAVDGSGGR